MVKMRTEIKKLSFVFFCHSICHGVIVVEGGRCSTQIEQLYSLKLCKVTSFSTNEDI
jgi:hypothetical protein